jgi:hypothetical protein
MRDGLTGSISMNKLLRITAAVAAAGALALSGSSIAFAVATPPAGDTFYSAGYDEGGEGSTAFWRVHPGEPGTLTVIQATHDDPEMITDGAYDASTGRSYLLAHGYEPECELWSVDVATGAYTLVGPITQDHEMDGPEPRLSEDCNAFDILDDGTAYVTIFDVHLYQLDLTTGAATFVADTMDDEDSSVNLSAIATQSSTGISYGIDRSGNVYTVDLGTGGSTFLINSGDLEPAFDADFDSAGLLWVTSWLDLGIPARLTSISDLNDIAGSLESTDIAGWATDALWIVPGAVDDDDEEAPVLANTGAAPLPLALGALILLLTGTGIVVLRRRTA